jgi:hypothetical protein
LRLSQKSDNNEIVMLSLIKKFILFEGEGLRQAQTDRPMAFEAASNYLSDK